MKRIIFDYSTSYYSNGQFTGIPRTVESLANSLEKVCNLPLDFVIFDEETKLFKNFKRVYGKALNTYIPETHDLFLCSGAPWVHEGYLEAISDIKSSINKFILIVHDLIPYLFPHFYEEPKFGKYYYDYIEKLSVIANQILCNSISTRDDLIKCVKNLSITDKSSVIHLGCDFHKQSNKKVEVRVEDLKQYILCVGTIELRKNQNFLLKVYRQILLQNNDFPKLVFAGRIGFGNNEIKHQITYDSVLKDKVIIFDCLDDNSLNSLYQNCLFTVYPSLYEGWGLPVSESLMHGKNVICSNTSSMKEIAPDLCHLADPLNPKQWSEIINLLVSDSSYRDQGEQKILKGYKATTWENTAEEILKFL